MSDFYKITGLTSVDDEIGNLSQEAYIKLTSSFFSAGEKAERERIIKLLEEANPEYFGCPHWQEHSKIEIAYLVALTKGEQR